MNYHKQLMAQFVIYADFECITVPINEKHRNNTEAYQVHKACGYGYKILCQYDNQYNKPINKYRGTDAVYKLIENLLKEEKKYKKHTHKKQKKKKKIIKIKKKKIKINKILIKR